jgi:hypothetical protein
MFNGVSKEGLDVMNRKGILVFSMPRNEYVEEGIITC